MNQNEEAEERGEEIPPIEPPAEGLGEAKSVDASSLVADDTDRPVADNKLPPPTPPGNYEQESGTSSPDQSPAPNVNPPPKKRGRKPMSVEEKAQAKAIREAVKAGKPAPDFSSINKTLATPNGQSQQTAVARDYYLEACNIFFPVSMGLGKFLGPHWSIPIVEKEISGIKQKCLEPTDSQREYLANMARWLEYEKFPPPNPRWSFLASTAVYGGPLLRTEPTPTKLKGAWEWVRVKLLRKEPRPVKEENKNE